MSWEVTYHSAATIQGSSIHTTSPSSITSFAINPFPLFFLNCFTSTFAIVVSIDEEGRKEGRDTYMSID